MSEKLPRFGPRSEVTPERACLRALGIPGQSPVCRKPPILHVIWEDRGPGVGVEQGWVCAAHAGELRGLRVFATHPVGHDCGMPGSLYYVDENVCRAEDLPSAEPVRAVAIEAAQG